MRVGPAGAQAVPECVTPLASSAVDELRKFELGRERGADVGVQRRVLGRRDLAEPVGAAPAVPAGEQAVEEMVRRRVHDDLRQVLAADEIDVVDAEIGGHDLVAGRTVRALPLDQDRRPAAQAVARGEEGAPVHQRGGEDVAVLPFLPRPQRGARSRPASR